MQHIKTWVKSSAGTIIIGNILGTVLIVLAASVRWKIVDKGGLQLVKSDEAIIFANWHSRVLGLSLMITQRRPLTYMISSSRDGQAAAQICKRHRINTIFVSDKENALIYYRKIYRNLKAGQNVGFTLDGPRGPARKAALGALMLAKSSGAAIIPLAWSSARMTRFNTWDRMALPKLFTRGVQYFGAPIYIPKDADDAAIEAARLALEDAVNDLCAEADAVFGHPPDHGEHRYGSARKKR